MTHVYPTLEDMKVSDCLKDQAEARIAMEAAATNTVHSMAAVPGQPQQTVLLYPSLTYMGLDLSALAQQYQTQIYPEQNRSVATSGQLAVEPSGGNSLTVAPVTGNDAGMLRAEIKPGVRRITLCKDGRGLIGCRVHNFDQGIFVCWVEKATPAAQAGLRFADQLIEVNGQALAGWTWKKVHEFVKKSHGERIELVVRDRPFCRTVTLVKDSHGGVGFAFKDGRIGAIVDGSSASRNGLLTDHQLVEVDGQCVVGFKDKEILHVIQLAQSAVTVTYMPAFLYDHIVKCLGKGMFKKQDHSIPDF